MRSGERWRRNGLLRVSVAGRRFLRMTGTCVRDLNGEATVAVHDDDRDGDLEVGIRSVAEKSVDYSG